MIKAAIILLLLTMGQAKAHIWYDQMCCSEKDCRQTARGEVERRPDGWFHVPTKTLVTDGDHRLRHSLDPLIHVCLIPPANTLRCLYIPDVAG